MKQTIQALSLRTETNVKDNNLSIQKPEAQDNMSLMLSILDKLNNLYDKLNRLNYLIQRKKIKQILKLN
jgi:hypothetical protein